MTTAERSIERSELAAGPVEPSRFLPSQFVHGYELLEKLGEGGFGEAWLATDGEGRRVVLKFPAALGGAGALAALRREVEVFERLSAEFDPAAPPPIVPLLADMLERDPPALVMEHMAGGDLRQYMRIQGGPVPVSSTNRIVADILQALKFAHARGVAHRDLSPENVLFDNVDYRWKVADFGLARLAIQNELSLERSGRTANATAAIAGKLHYMAPETAGGSETAGPPADIYALGVIWAQLLTGDGEAGLPAHWHQEIADEKSRDRVATCLLRDPAKRPTAVDLLRPRGKRWLDRVIVSDTGDLVSSQVTLRDIVWVSFWMLVVVLCVLAFASAFLLRGGPGDAKRVAAILAKVEREQATRVRVAPTPLPGEKSVEGFAQLVGPSEVEPQRRAQWVYPPESGARRTIALGGGEEMAFRWVPAEAGAAGFWLGETEVTVGQWRRLWVETQFRSFQERRRGMPAAYTRGLRSNGRAWSQPSYKQSSAHPVVNVCAEDALVFCAWLSSQSTLPVALPNTRQWQRAARLAGLPGPTLEAGADYGWIGGAKSGACPQAVGQKRSDHLGLLDMIGNVAEICRIGATPDIAADVAFMGGSWGAAPGSPWASDDIRGTSRAASEQIGFRVAIQLDPDNPK